VGPCFKVVALSLGGLLGQGGFGITFRSRDARSLSENNVCALKLGEIGKLYGRKTLTIPPILSIQMLFSDRLLD